MDNPLVFTRQFLDALARGLSELLMEPLLGVGSLEKTLVESIQTLHQRLADALPSTERRLGLAQLTRMPTVLAEAQIQDVLIGIPGIGKKEKAALAGYLGGIVQVTRQRSRRLDDPKGKNSPEAGPWRSRRICSGSFPPGRCCIAPASGWEILPCCGSSARMAWVKPGKRAGLRPPSLRSSRRNASRIRWMPRRTSRLRMF